MTKLSILLLVIASACSSGNPQMHQDVQTLVNGTKPDLDSCYQIALARNRHLNGGFFTVDAVVEGATGQFKDVVVRRNEVNDPAVTQCVVMAVRALKLAKPTGQNNTQVSFAFRFTAQ